MFELRSALRKVGHCFSGEDILDLSSRKTIGERWTNVHLGSGELMGGVLRVGDT